MRGIGRLRLYLTALKDYRHFVAPGGENLIAGPYIGEFGYECMEWQSFVNAQAGRFKKIYVISYPGRAALYPECELITHQFDLATAGYGHGRRKSEQLLQIAKMTAARLGLRSYRIFLPTILAQPLIRKLIPQRWMVFGGRSNIKYDVAFHFRNIRKEGPDKRINFSLNSADQLAILCQHAGLACVAIGHPEQSHCPPCCIDCRSVELQCTIDVIGSARLVVGQLSGPMHLASLCKKSIVTWAEGAHRIALARRWNPHQTQINVVTDSTFCPEPLDVIKAIENCHKMLAGK
jgi:hypothetical protein